jgi:hypothetical protein
LKPFVKWVFPRFVLVSDDLERRKCSIKATNGFKVGAVQKNNGRWSDIIDRKERGPNAFRMTAGYLLRMTARFLAANF